MKKLIETIKPINYKFHLIVVLGFIIISSFFYYPVLFGKEIFQSDISQYRGMAKEIIEQREKNKKETYWIDNAFGGMPTFQLGAKYPYDILTPIHKVFRILPHPIFLMFLYFFSFYIFLIVIKIPIKYSVLGSLAYGLSTYLLIIIQVGHNTKAQAMGYLPLVLAGIIMIFQKRYKWGLILSIIAIALQIRANHYQISYYLILLIIPLIILKFIEYYRRNNLKTFLKKVSLIFISGLIGVGLNFTSILSTAEYSKFSTRGKSELSIDNDGNKVQPSSGLEYDYITQYSMGIFESFNTIIPRIQGGASRENVGKDSNLYKHLINNGVPRSQANLFIENVPTYWGSQPILEAPPYIGISVFFLAILSIFLSITTLKKWLILGSLFSILLSWGKNFPILTNFFIDYFPLYNKFRAVSSIQVVLEFCVPVLAVIGLNEIFSKKHLNKKGLVLKIFSIFSILLLILYLSKSILSFASPNDMYFSQVYGSEILSLIKESRIDFFVNDLLRSFLFLVLITSLLIAYLKHSRYSNIILIGVYLTFVFDLFGISERYINRDVFVPKSKISKPFEITSADKSILRDTTRYRVYEPSIGLNGSRTSFFHNSIGGYHGAKPRRFQELYDFFVKEEISGIIDMLNVKYLLYRDDEDNLKPMKNPNFLGNAWFVNKLIKKESLDSVFYSMKSIDFSNTAITNSNIANSLPNEFLIDDNSYVKLSSHESGNLKYISVSKEDSFIVFSEIFYPNGWEVYVDGVLSSHFDVNYILRGMFIEKGSHEIEFVFKPDAIKLGSLVQLSSIVIFILIILNFIYSFYKKNKIN